MGRKSSKRDRRQASREKKQSYVPAYKREEEEDKGHEALQGHLVPSWWHKADAYQVKYSEAMKHHKVVMVDKFAGTGKTTIAVMEALHALKAGRVDVIRYVRFVDGRTQSLGALPGNEDEKENGFMYPFYEAMQECGVQDEYTDMLIEDGSIELSTDIHLRGRNMKRTFLVIDECQNGDIEDIRLVFTRLHETGKGVAIGHSKQVDRKMKRYGVNKLTAFQVYTRHMTKKSWAIECDLVKDYRGEISRWADQIEITLAEVEAEGATIGIDGLSL